MGGGSGGGSTTSTTSNLPTYARPYFERMMERTETESNRPYEAYSGSRIQGFTGDQNAGFDITRGVADRGAPELGTAGNFMGAAGMAGMGTTNYQANALGADMWGAGARDAYMSPYMDGVVQRQQAGAIQQFQEGRGARDTSAIGAGAFGGSRHGVAEGVARRGLEDRLSDIQAQGLQSGYENAQQQFNADRSMQFAADATNEQNRAGAAGIRQQGAQIGLQAGTAFRDLGAMDQGLALQRGEAMQGIGQQQQALDQRSLDTAYDDFVNQRDYGRQQLTFLNGMLRGVPVSPQQEVRTTQNANPLAQAAGLGIAGIGAYRAMG